MTTEHDFEAGFITGFLLKQNNLQKQIIEHQAEIIRLQQQVEKMTPGAPDKDVNWNKVSGGLTSTEAIEGSDLQVLESLQEWIHTFGEKYIKPYVHHRAYAEMIAHMSRGISERLAELEYAQEFGVENSTTMGAKKRTSKKQSKDESDTSSTIPLFPPDKDPEN